MTVFPPAPNWYQTQIVASSSDGRVVYGSKNAIVILTRTDLTPIDPDAATVLSEENNSNVSGEAEKVPESESPPKQVEDEARSSEVVSHPNANILSMCGDKTKITCVAWSPDCTFIGVGFDDGLVRLVKVEGTGSAINLSIVQFHSTHKEVSKLRSRVNTISWSKPNPDIVVTGDESGLIVAWDVKMNSTRFVSFVRQSITVLETHPVLGDVVGFGCRLGLVFIADISGAGKILQKIRAHDEDVQSLSWSPSQFWDVLRDDENRTEDNLLAVASRDKTVTIWSSKTGRRIASLKLPGRNEKLKQKHDNSKFGWSTCHWLKRDVLLTSGCQGELLEWHLQRIKRKSKAGDFFSEGQEAQVVHRVHQRTLYSICSLDDGTLFTTGQDRFIVAFNYNRRSLLFTLPTFASGVYSIAANHFDPTVVAISAGDGQIRIWKTASSKATFDVSYIWNRLGAAKITALAWHPDKEGVLAFGTDEGRVGYVDSFSPRSNPMFSEFSHRTTVYSVCWGPAIADTTDDKSSKNASDLKKVLYSCGDNAVYMHSVGFDNSINIDKIANAERRTQKRTDVAFQPTFYRFIVLGCEDGSVEIFSMPKFEPICILKSFNKLIQSIAWHPQYTGTSAEVSELRNWIAVASNEHDVHVWDLTNALEGPNVVGQDERSPDDVTEGNEVSETESCAEKEERKIDAVIDETKSSDVKAQPVPVLTKPARMLSGHYFRVIYLAWSPHKDGKLLSVSYDNTATVWDAASGTALANFSGHSNKLFCGIFSPVDDDIVYTGADDATVFGWKISEQTNALPQKKATKKFAGAKEATIPAEMFDEFLEERKRTIQQTEKQQSPKRRPQSGGSIDIFNTIKEATTAQLDLKSVQAKRKQRNRALFGISNQSQSNSVLKPWTECELLMKFHNETSPPSPTPTTKLKKPLHLGFFAGRDTLTELLDQEVTHLREQDQVEFAGYLRTMTGDYGEAVRHAIQGGKLTDWFIGLAQATSYELWLEACQAYAQQLIKEEEVVKGCTYLLMIGQVIQAIETLKKKEFFQAAVAVAKSRLPPDSPTLKDVYSSWAVYSLTNGQFEMSAKCWIAAGDLRQAATTLSKLPGPDAVRVASLLSFKAGDRESSRVLAIQCADKCIENKAWACLDKLNEACDFPEVKQLRDKSLEQRSIKADNDALSEASPNVSDVDNIGHVSKNCAIGSAGEDTEK